MESVNEHRFEKETTKEKIRKEAVNKKYSTFDLYNNDEFQESLTSFQNWLNSKTNINYIAIAEISEIIFKKV